MTENELKSLTTVITKASDIEELTDVFNTYKQRQDLLTDEEKKEMEQRAFEETLEEAATLDEQKIIANTLFYLAQITDETNATAYTAEDIAPPDIPKVDLSQQYGNRGVYDVEVSGRDNGTVYQHYVEAIDEEGNMVKSNTTTTTVITGIKGYSWVIDGNPGTNPDNTIDSTLTTITQGQTTLYIHIKAIDGAGNVGPTLHMQLTVNHKGNMHNNSL